MSRFLGLGEDIAANKLFNSLYTDRDSHYRYTEATGSRIQSKSHTQRRRAMRDSVAVAYRHDH